MEIKNVTLNQLQRALDYINANRYKGNIRWARKLKGCIPLNLKKTRFRVRLECHSSKEPGHRVTRYRDRRLVSACWHVHGHFFDALLRDCPNAEIRSRNMNFINKTGGNWQDFNIGSILYPFMASEACDC